MRGDRPVLRTILFLEASGLQPFTELQGPMRFNPTDCKHLQGAADARRRIRRRPFILQVPGNKADAVSCERLPRLDVGFGRPAALPLF